MTDTPVRLRAEIAALPPYKQGKAAPGGHKLSSNENPFDPLPGVVAAVTDAMTFNRYPDATAARLRGVLAERFGVTADEVHITSGSVAALAQLIVAASGPGDEVIFAWRSFEAYPGLVTVAGSRAVRVPNRVDGGHDLPAMADAVTEQTRVVIVCSPNNPTGPVVTAEEFEDFIARVPDEVLVLLDEAYAEFVTDDAAVDGLAPPMFHRHPNVVVLRTFSKAYGLAGLRVGYAVGHRRVLDAARSAGIPLSVTAQAEEAALASLEPEAERALIERVAVIRERRDALAEGLREQGWFVPEAQGNFVWLATGEDSAAAAEAFDRDGIVVRAFPGEGVRISVGDERSVEKVLGTAGSIVEGLPKTHPARPLA